MKKYKRVPIDTQVVSPCKRCDRWPCEEANFRHCEQIDRYRLAMIFSTNNAPGDSTCDVLGANLKSELLDFV